MEEVIQFEDMGAHERHMERTRKMFAFYHQKVSIVFCEVYVFL
jgi:hypothetical protein